ncbi:MAG: deaminase [Frankiales bacterium]|nr:deaminase [Frankiales bacterium]
MGKLIYIANTSLDGYTEDPSGNFDWSEPDDEVFALITDLIRPVGTHLYGRRMYETMAVWETDPSLGAQSEPFRDFAAVWSAADKLVYSTTLTEGSTARTRVESSFDPTSVRALKDSTTGDLTVGGPVLAGQAIQSGLVDEIHLFVTPILLGGGKAALPKGVRTQLELLDERRFDNGAVHVRYRVLS